MGDNEAIGEGLGYYGWAECFAGGVGNEDRQSAACWVLSCLLGGPIAPLLSIYLFLLSHSVTTPPSLPGL